MATAEEALKKYYDKMIAMDERLKYDLEQQRLRRQGFSSIKNEDSDDELPLTWTDEQPSQSTISGQMMLRDMFDERKRINEQNLKRAKQASEQPGNGLKLRADDLITMTVPEKLEYLANRRKHLNK